MTLALQVLTGQIVDDTARIYKVLAGECMYKHRRLFDDIARHLSGGSVRQKYVLIAREFFGDGEINWGRIVTLLAFAIYMQRRFRIDLANETSSIIEERFYYSILPRRESELQRNDWSAYIQTAMTNFIRMF